jgi:hypothetical protein
MRRKIALWSLGVVLMLAIVAEAAAYAETLRERRKAEHLLADIRALHIGESNEQAVRQLAKEYGGRQDDFVDGFCGPIPGSAYRMQVANDTLNKLAWALPGFRWFGNRVWTADALLIVKRGTLCYVSYRITAFPVEQHYVMDVRVNALLSPGPPAKYVPPYVVDAGLMRDEWRFWVDVLTDATEDQKNRAFDFDLSCLTRPGGCHAGCELMPSAWLDYQSTVRENGWSLPSEDANDHRCKKL